MTSRTSPLAAGGLTPTEVPELRFDSVSHRFATTRRESVPALDGIDLRIEPRSFVSVVGPSGCGKSTLLRMASGLLQPTEGSVWIGDSRVTGIRSDVGFVTQDSNLYPWLTLRGNVEFPLQVRGVEPAKRAELVDRYIAMVGLEGFGDHYPHQLSGGMQKRASIIRTLVYDPQVILMDEPFGAVDAQTRMRLQAELLKLWDATEKTVLFITHDLAEAVTLSDYVVIMSRRPGRIKGVFHIDLPRPRDVYDMQATPGFADMYNTIWQEFRSEVDTLPIDAE